MSKTVDFYYDFISPASYLAWTQLIPLCEREGATINYKPMLLGGVFKATDNTSPITNPAKWRWLQDDFSRFAKHYAVPYQLNPHFIFNTIQAMRGAIWAKSTNQIEVYNRAMFTAAWAEGKDLSDQNTFCEILTLADIDPDDLLHATSQPEIKKALIDATQEAVEQGVFGAPTFIVDGELFFGQDRLLWVEQALQA